MPPPGATPCATAASLASPGANAIVSAKTLILDMPAYRRRSECRQAAGASGVRDARVSEGRACAAGRRDGRQGPRAATPGGPALRVSPAPIAATREFCGFLVALVISFFYAVSTTRSAAALDDFPQNDAGRPRRLERPGDGRLLLAPVGRALRFQLRAASTAAEERSGCRDRHQPHGRGGRL